MEENELMLIDFPLQMEDKPIEVGLENTDQILVINSTINFEKIKLIAKFYETLEEMELNASPMDLFNYDWNKLEFTNYAKLFDEITKKIDVFLKKGYIKNDIDKGKFIENYVMIPLLFEQSKSIIKPLIEAFLKQNKKYKYYIINYKFPEIKINSVEYKCPS